MLDRQAAESASGRREGAQEEVKTEGRVNESVWSEQERGREEGVVLPLLPLSVQSLLPVGQEGHRSRETLGYTPLVWL